jgi:hypothetical protein
MVRWNKTRWLPGSPWDDEVFQEAYAAHDAYAAQHGCFAPALLVS